MKKIYKVLLAEDDPISAKLVKHTLGRYNFKVEHVEDGRMALGKVKLYQYDLAIIDIMMPIMDGQMFVEKGNDELKKAGTKVIMLTALSNKENVLRAATNNVDLYLLKPITQKVLFEKIRETMGLEEEDLIDKKEFPFQVRIQGRSEYEIEILFSGIPIDEITDEVFNAYSAHFNHFFTQIPSSVEIKVPEDFYYCSDALKYLESAIDELTKKARLKLSNVVFSGDFFAYYKRTDIAALPNLSACKVLFPKKKDS